jgi:hypothetical protein
MTFEALATEAGKTAAAVGRASERPPFHRVLAGYNRRAVIVAWSTVAAIAIVLIGTMSLWTGSDSDLTPLATLTPLPGSTEATGEYACPVTIPGDDSFDPVSETPEMEPPDPRARWFGTPELWTSVHPEGEIWEGLPKVADGSLTQKTLWWSEDIVSITDPLPEMEFYAERLDATGQSVTARQVTSGGNGDQGVFVIAGFQIPEEGCWRITAEYLGSTVSYVVSVPGTDQKSQTVALLDGSELIITGASDLEPGGYLFTVEVPGLGPSNVDLVLGLDPTDPSIVDETAVLDTNLGEGVRLFKADRDGQPLFMTVDLGGWVAVVNVGSEQGPANEDMLAIAEQLEGTAGPSGVVLTSYTPEVFTTYLRDPDTGNQVHLMANRCVRELVPGSEIVDHPRLGELVRGTGYGSWCDEDAAIEVVLYGDETFVEQMVNELRLSRS